MPRPYTHEELREAILAEGKTLLGNRVAVLVDEVAETFGNSDIIVPETHTALYKPMAGHIVVMGTGTKVGEDCNSHYMNEGDKVTYNKYNVIGFRLNLEAFDEPVQVDVLHSSDLYWSWE